MLSIDDSEEVKRVGSPFSQEVRGSIRTLGFSIAESSDVLLDERAGGAAVLIDIKSAKPLHTFGTDENPISDAALAPDGKSIIVLYRSGVAERWRLPEFQLVFRSEPRQDREQDLVEAVARSGSSFVVRSNGRHEVRDGESGAALWADVRHFRGYCDPRSVFAIVAGVEGVWSPSGELLRQRPLLDNTHESVMFDPCTSLGYDWLHFGTSSITGHRSMLPSLELGCFREDPTGLLGILEHEETFGTCFATSRPADGAQDAVQTQAILVAYDSVSRSLLTLHPDALLTFDPMRIDRFPVSGVIANVLLGAASADGERLVAINQDSLQIIDADGLHERLRVDHSGATTRAVALNATGELLAILDASGELSLRSAPDNSVLARGSVSAEFASASPRCAIGSDGSIAVANGRGDFVVFARSNDQLTERTRTSVSGGAVTAIVAVPARKEFLVGMKDGSTHVVDEASLAVRVTLPTNGHAIGAMTPSFDGLRYFTASDDGSIRIWHSETGKELLTLNEERITAAPTAIFIEPNNERLVVGYANGAERVWDAVTWAERVRRRGKPEWPNTEPKLVPVGAQADAPDNR
jgi:hypothetical protein